MNNTDQAEVRKALLAVMSARGWALLIIGTIIPVIVVLLFYWSEFGVYPANEHSHWAEFGDFFGGILNPIFAICAFIAVMMTILLQSKELRASTDSLKDQSNQLRDQSQHLRTQSFENTLFSLLQMHTENVRTLVIKQQDKEETGRRAFKVLKNRLEWIYKGVQDEEHFETENALLQEVYYQFYRQNEHEIGHYLRALDRLFDFIYERGKEVSAGSETEDTDRCRQYWLIVRAQLSSDELLIIFYHFYIRTDFFDFDELLKREIFQYLPSENLLNAGSHQYFLKRGQD